MNTDRREHYIKLIRDQHGDRSYLSLIPENITRRSRVNVGCKKHGIVSVLIATLVIGRGCRQCGYETNGNRSAKSRREHIDAAIAVHGNKYDYSELPQHVRSNNTTKYDIICPVHGKFRQTMQHHCRGHGCGKCGSVGRGGSGIERYNGNLEILDGPGLLYIIHVFDDDEEFIKIGMTKNCLEKRYPKCNLNNYQYNVILEDTSLSLQEAYDLEQKLLTEFASVQYVPSRYFRGYSECLEYSDTNIDLLKAYVDTLVHVA